MPILGKGYSAELEHNKKPIAIILPVSQEAVLGSIVKVDGRASRDTENGTELTYEWSFAQIPIGSQIQKFDFQKLEDDLSVMSFAPDVIGVYKVQLIVYDTNLLPSEPTLSEVDVRIILVPHHQGITPDASFIWKYLSDFWDKVDGKKRFDTFWSAGIQIVASEMLKAYQYDYNKSIKDIQGVLQKRWIHYEAGLSLDETKCSFILADDRAGLEASSFEIDRITGLPNNDQPDYTTFISIPKDEANLEVMPAGLLPAQGRVMRFGDRTVTFQRMFNSKRSIIHNKDGELTSGTKHLTSAIDTFTVDMVGYSVHFLNNEDLEDAVDQTELNCTIASFIDGQTVSLDIDDNWPSTFTDVEFTIVPNIPTHNSFFADRAQVPGKQKDKVWRFSSTLISQEFDFEEQGVSPGDTIVIEVSRTDANLFGKLLAQVVGVDRNRLGFVLNTNVLEDGVNGGWVSDDAIISLVTDLQIRGLFLAEDRSLIFTDQIGLIHDTVDSIKFRRAYFEKGLSTDTEINVGAMKFKFRPVQVIRNKHIPIDAGIVSIPVLQEYVRQPSLSTKEDGTVIIQTEGGVIERKDEPVILLENFDYVVDDQTSIKGTCNTTAGDEYVEIPFGDLIDRSIKEGDTLNINIAGRFEPFTVARIIDEEHLRLIQPVPITGVQVRYTISRRVGGKFIRFVQRVYNPANPAPPRLWAEVTYFDNNANVENNFGVMVGLTRDDHARSNASVPYKDAVAGLMYALTTGSTVSNMGLSAQILLGLPFTQRAGVVTEINPDFRKNDNGSPQYGRLLVEAKDDQGLPIGVTNIYLYPHGRQIPDPDLPGGWIPAVPEFSGLAINPATGKEYAVGDFIDQFVPVSKGVRVEEYLDTPDWFRSLIGAGNTGIQIQIYHTWNLVVNTDLISASDLDLTASFIKGARPHYTRLRSVLLKEVEDFIPIEDTIDFKAIFSFFEGVSGSMPSAYKVGFAPHLSRDFNESFIASPGIMYARYIEGLDLATTQGSSTFTSAAGGFINPRPAFGESHDVPFVRPGDLLVVMEGPNQGNYNIASVTSDTGVVVDLDSRTMETLTPVGDPPVPEQAFTIYRPIKNPIWRGTVTVSNSSGTVQVPAGGLMSAGVAVGDNLVFVTQTSPARWSKMYVIKDIDITNLVGGAQILTIHAPISELTGSYDAVIVRETLLKQDLLLGADSTFGTQYVFTTTNGSHELILAPGSEVLSAACVRRGDRIVIRSNEYIVIRNDGANGKLWISSPFPFTSPHEVSTILRSGRGPAPLTLDILDRLTGDSIDLTLTLSGSSTNRLLTTFGSNVVNTVLNDNLYDLGLRVGEQIVIITGPDSTVDAGHGPGVYIAIEFVTPSQVKLHANMTSTQVAPGVFYAIRKRNLHAEG